MASVNSGGVEIVYDVLNPDGSGIPVFFIAGLNGMRQACMKQALPFSRERPVVVHDQRGTGASGKPLGVYSVQNMAKDVVAIMDARRHRPRSHGGHLHRRCDRAGAVHRLPGASAKRRRLLLLDEVRPLLPPPVRDAEAHSAEHGHRGADAADLDDVERSQVVHRAL